MGKKDERVSGLAEFFFDFLDGGQRAFEFFRKLAGELIFADANGLGHAAQGVFRDEAFPILAEDDADAGLVVGVSHLVIHHVEVEVHLGCVLGFEGSAFQIDDDEAAQLEVIEKEVDVEIVVSEFEVDLATDKREAGAEFDEELAEVLHQPEFEIPLTCGVAEGEKVEVVRIFYDLLGEIGLGIWQGLFEIGDRLAFTLVEIGFDLKG